MKVLSLGCLLLLVGCGVLNPPDVSATLLAENQAIVQEATAIARAARVDNERVQATADFAATQVASLRQINLALLATVRAGDPPRPRVVAETDIRPVSLTPGQRWFVKTGVASKINDSDGCVRSPQISFVADTPIIYATMRAFNVEAGLELSSVWNYEGAEVHRERFTLDQNWAEVCLWFSIDPSTVDFAPGNWTVQMFANGAQLEAPMAFSLREGEEIMDG